MWYGDFIRNDSTNVQVLSVEENSNSIKDDLLEGVKQHLRIEHDDEDDLITSYIGAAIEAAENHLQKDIYPRTYSILWTGGNYLTIDGRVRDLTVVMGEDEVDDLPNLIVTGRLDYFKGAGVRLMAGYGAAWVPQPTYPPLPALGRTVGFVSGFDDVDTLPDAVKVFVYAFTGTLYENRETVNIGAGKYTVEEIPTWLLKPLEAKPIV